MPKKSKMRAQQAKDTKIFAALWTEVEAAAFIKMSVAFLRAGRAQGDLERRTPSPAFVRCGRSIRYAKADLEAWIASHRTDPERASRG
jgi:hypothetical protein